MSDALTKLYNFVRQAPSIRKFSASILQTNVDDWQSLARAFDRSFGFSGVTKATRQCRGGDVELVCSAPLKLVHAAVLRQLPKLMSRFNVGPYTLRSDILISIKPKYAEQILSGSKLVEIRMSFPKNGSVPEQFCIHLVLRKHSLGKLPSVRSRQVIRRMSGQKFPCKLAVLRRSLNRTSVPQRKLQR
jgi:hypothetical protein